MLVLSAVLALTAPGDPPPWFDAFACAAVIDRMLDDRAGGPAAAPALARTRLAGQAAAENALQAGYPAWADARRAAGGAPLSPDQLRAEARVAARARVDALAGRGLASGDADALARVFVDLGCMERVGPELDRLALD